MFTRSNRHFSRQTSAGVRVGLLAISIVVGLLAASPLSASAHDKLLSSNPEANAVLEIAPTKIELSFNNKVLPVGSAVEVKDAHGAAWQQGEAKTDDVNVIATLKPGMPSGQYTVSWRAVSSDGHPIEGQIPFTVKIAAAATPAATTSAVSSTASVASPSTMASSAATATATTPAAVATSATAKSAAESKSSGVPPVLYGVIGALVLLALVLGIKFYRGRAAKQ